MLTVQSYQAAVRQIQQHRGADDPKKIVGIHQTNLKGFWLISMIKTVPKESQVNKTHPKENSSQQSDKDSQRTAKKQTEIQLVQK